MNRYRKLTVSLLAAWFVFAVAGSASHAFANSRGFGLGVALAAAIPLVLFLIWFRTSAGFRQFTMSLDPQVLTLVHSWRIFGFTFVLLEAHGLLPALFAWPAGFGDMAVGMTASLVAWKTANPAHRSAFLRWQALGIADLVTAVTLGATAGVIHPQGVSTGLMTVLPLSLIPTFLVPLYLMLHIISIAQARKWPSSPKGNQPANGRLQPSAG